MTHLLVTDAVVIVLEAAPGGQVNTSVASVFGQAGRAALGRGDIHADA